MGRLRHMSPLDRIEVSEEIAPLPRADLHLHAEAGPRLDRILSKGRGQGSYDWAKWTEEVMRDFSPGLARLEQMSKPLITDDEDVVPRNFLARVTNVLHESAASGAIYVEVRFGRETVTRADFMRLFRVAEETVREQYPDFMAEALATLVPQQDMVLTGRMVEACLQAASEGLAGVDIIPEPYATEAEWTGTYRWAERLAGAGLPITVHAGEFSTANIVAALQAPGVRRIGHGIQAAGDNRILDSLVQSGVALECCLTSNVVLGAVPSYADHPVRQLVDAGVNVTLNTDNPVRFCTSIDREYEIAARIGFDAETLVRFTETAIRFAFTTPVRRTALLAQSAIQGSTNQDRWS